MPTAPLGSVPPRAGSLSFLCWRSPPRCSTLAFSTEGQGGSKSHRKGTGALGRCHQLKRGPSCSCCCTSGSPSPCVAHRSPGRLVPPGPRSGSPGKQQLGALPHAPRVDARTRHVPAPVCGAWAPVVPSCLLLWPRCTVVTTRLGEGRKRGFSNMPFRDFIYGLCDPCHCVPDVVGPAASWKAGLEGLASPG